MVVRTSRPAPNQPFRLRWVDIRAMVQIDRSFFHGHGNDVVDQIRKIAGN